MKTRILNTLILSATLAIPLIGLSACSQEVSHTESDQPGWFGGHKHEETTTTKNPITGDTNTSHTEQKTN